MVSQAQTAPAPPIASQEIRGDTAFVEEDIASHVTKGLPGAPPPAGRRDVRPTLFVGVDGFF